AAEFDVHRARWVGSIAAVVVAREGEKPDVDHRVRARRDLPAVDVAEERYGDGAESVEVSAGRGVELTVGGADPFQVSADDQAVADTASVAVVDDDVGGANAERSELVDGERGAVAERQVAQGANRAVVLHDRADRSRARETAQRAESDLGPG